MKNKSIFIAIISILVFALGTAMTCLICLPAGEEKTAEVNTDSIEKIEESYVTAEYGTYTHMTRPIKKLNATNAVYVEYMEHMEAPEKKISESEISESENTASEEIPDYILEECPLTIEQQTYIYEVCQENDVDFLFVMAMMDVESDYIIDSVSRTGDYGLMQINICNHKEGLDYLDFETNVDEGVAMISTLVHKYDTLDMALMAYNMGEYGASQCWENGIYSSAYSREIMDTYEQLQIPKPIQI